VPMGVDSYRRISTGKRACVHRLICSLVFALAIVDSALLFKGNPALHWVEAGLMVAAFTLVILKSSQPAIRRERRIFP
jgi:hypothetical protein